MALPRRLGAAAVSLVLLALVACDLWIAGVRTWWDRHSLTSSLVASLLVVAVTALIVDEVIARRQRRQRAVAVAVQGFIVYGQAYRAYEAVVAADGARLSGASDELRTLASMVLTASSSLFEDPEARRFLDQVERFLPSMVRAESASSGGALGAEDREKLRSEASRLRATIEPLLARIPSEDRSALEGLSQA